MLYVLAFLFPPVACLACGKISSAVINFMLCASGLLIPVAWIQAFLVVQEYERQHQRGSSVNVRVESRHGRHDDDDDRPRRRRRDDRDDDYDDRPRRRR